MDLAYTEQQLMLKNVIQDLLRRDLSKEALVDIDRGTGNFKESWAALTSTGVLGSLIPEEFGGVGGSFMDTAVIYEELGKGPVAGPHFDSAVLGALLIIEAGTEAQKATLLPGIANGDGILGLAITEIDYGWSDEFVSATATQHGSHYVLNGTKAYVQNPLHASDFIVAVRFPQGVGLVLIESSTPGVDVREFDAFGTGIGQVEFSSVEFLPEALLGAPGSGWVDFDRAATQSLPILSAYQSGGLDRVFDMCLTYSQTRHQFQQPIGRFQRVQDHIIDIVNYRDAARWTTYEAIWKLDTEQDDYEAAVRVSAITASEGYYLACNAAHDVHAGVGIVREYGLTLHTQMSRTLYHYLGSPNYHRRRLADQIL